MICPNCHNEVVNEAVFCPNCGYKLNINNVNINLDNSKKDKGNKKPFYIVLLVVVFLLIGTLCFVGINYLNRNKSNELTSDDNNPNEVEGKLNTLEKIKQDYENGKLNLNEYFKELVYSEFDSSKLNSKYTSDYEYINTDCELETLNLLEEHYNELDKDIVKFYLTNKTLANVSLGKNTITSTSNSQNNFKVDLLKDSDQENAYNHQLNSVYLSSNGHFLIWYDEMGEDRISINDIHNLGDGLESSISSFEKKFNIQYSYTPYVDNKYFNEDFKNAKNVLIQNNLDPSLLNTAMSVYVYDTGSDITLASYNDVNKVSKFLNRSLLLDILDKDGIVNYPYIIINKRGLSNKNNLEALYNHELFHHMQYLYCRETTNALCQSNPTIMEGMANFASAELFWDKNSFLNDWATVYTKNTSVKLEDIADKSGSKGYALFPYFEAYKTSVPNWLSILMEAHNEQNPFSYIQNNTSKENLIKTINNLARKTLAQDYENRSYLSNEPVSFKKLNTKNNLTINPGSIEYFEISKSSKYTITIDSDYITILEYGYDGEYHRLGEYNKNIEFDTTLDANYDKLYLVITNADLLNTHNYTVEVKNWGAVEDNEESESPELKTTFNNYNIEISMKMKTSGMEISEYAKGIVDELHQKEYLDFETTTMGMTLSNKIYYDFSSGYTYMTQPYGGDVWWKEKGTSQLVDLGKMINKIKKMDNVKKEKNYYKVTLSKDDITDIMKTANAEGNIKGNVVADVYITNGYISKISYDFTGLMSGIDSFTTTINFSNYNQAGNVEIPSSVVNNAKVQG